MPVKYTNDFTVLKDILKSEYTFILSLLFNNFDEIIHLLKERQPFYGEILEYLYLSAPTYYSNTYDSVCKRYRYIDSLIRVLYKDFRKNTSAKFRLDVRHICEDFHIESQEFEYYYWVALFIIGLESSINMEAYNLYSELDEDIRNSVDEFLQLFINTLTRGEFQCMFYNHLEDVYRSNITDDNKVSIIYKDNYSYFLDNLTTSSFFVDPFQDNKEDSQYHIIISDENLYVVVDKKPIVLCPNQLINFDRYKSIRHIGLYDIASSKITNLIPIYKYFNGPNHIDCNLNREYSIQSGLIDSEVLKKSEPFTLYNNFDSNGAYYYIKDFTVYLL